MAKTEKTKPEERHFSYERSAISLIWVGVFVILAATIVYSFDIPLPFLSQHYGQYGEYIGGIVGSLWALAGVMLFYEALKNERTELKLQRHELELQRHEIIEQTEQYKVQNETLTIQMFENTFFQLLMMHNEIVNSIDIELDEPGQVKSPEKSARLIRGRDCFVEFYNYFKFIYMDHVELTSITNPSKEDMMEIIRESFERFYYMYQEYLGHYLRNLFNIVEFIDRNSIKNKAFYINLVHAHLSNYELIMLFYSNLSEIGTNFRHIIEKYGFLANIPDYELIDIRHKDLYSESAYLKPELPRK